MKVFKQCMKKTRKCVTFVDFKIKFPTFCTNGSKLIIPNMINTMSNICFKKFSIFFNQKISIIKITLSMVKENKNNETWIKITNKTNQTNSGNWTIKKCKEFLESREAPTRGTIDVLRGLCNIALKSEKWTQVGNRGTMSLN